MDDYQMLMSTMQQVTQTLMQMNQFRQQMDFKERQFQELKKYHKQLADAREARIKAREDTLALREETARLNKLKSDLYMEGQQQKIQVVQQRLFDRQALDEVMSENPQYADLGFTSFKEASARYSHAKDLSIRLQAEAQRNNQLAELLSGGDLNTAAQGIVSQRLAPTVTDAKDALEVEKIADVIRRAGAKSRRKMADWMDQRELARALQPVKQTAPPARSPQQATTQAPLQEPAMIQPPATTVKATPAPRAGDSKFHDQVDENFVQRLLNQDWTAWQDFMDMVKNRKDLEKFFQIMQDDLGFTKEQVEELKDIMAQMTE